MLDQHLKQLRSPDLQKRREAIVALGNAGDPAAISVLHQIAATDPDGALREIASKAEHHLQNLQWRSLSCCRPPIRVINSVPLAT